MTRRVERICGQAAAARGRRGRVVRAPSMRSATGCCASMPSRSASIPPSRCSIAATPPTCMNLVRDELGLSEQARRFPKKATCLAIYSCAVNAQIGARAGARHVVPLVPRVAGRAQAAVRRLCRGQAGAAGARLRRPAALLVEHDGRAGAGRGRRPALRLRPGRRVSGHQRAPGERSCWRSSPTGAASPWSATTPSRSTASARRPCATSWISRARFAPPGRGRHARAELPLDPADPGRRQRGHAPGAGRLQQELFSARALAAEAGARHRRATSRRGRLRGAPRSSRTARPGSPLREQAVLFRTSHHSGQLELELRRRNIPFVKFGGLKFLEAAHVKDVLACCAGPRTRATGSPAFGCSSSCPGSAPAPRAGRWRSSRRRPPTSRRSRRFAPAARRGRALAGAGRAACSALAAASLGRVSSSWSRRFYDPLLEERYDYARARAGRSRPAGRIAAPTARASSS